MKMSTLQNKLVRIMAELALVEDELFDRGLADWSRLDAAQILVAEVCIGFLDDLQLGRLDDAALDVVRPDPASLAVDGPNRVPCIRQVFFDGHLAAQRPVRKSPKSVHHPALAGEVTA